MDWKSIKEQIGAGLGYRAVLATGLFCSLYLTRTLWGIHASPPEAALLPGISLDYYYPLCLSILVYLVAPRPGLIIYWLALVFACLADQTRLQPSFFSMGILMVPATGGQRLSQIARWHIFCLWLYAGLHKLLSYGYLFPDSPWMLKAFMESPSPVLESILRFIIAGGEIILAVLIWRRPRLAGTLGFLLHLSIFLYLSPLGRNWNLAVWPWNLVLAWVSLYCLGLGEPQGKSPLADWRKAGPVLRALMLFFVLYPLGYYLGVSQAYLGINLYSENVPRAYVCRGESCRNLNDLHTLNILVPPEKYLYRYYFKVMCDPGDTLRIVEPATYLRPTPRVTEAACARK